MATNNHFGDITLLVTHYNRSRSLERLLRSFAAINLSFGDIVVSDDGSQPEHLDYLKSLQNSLSFRLVTTEKNKGLGNNINKGQDAVTTVFTFYVQEDFIALPALSEHFADGLAIINRREDIDMVRLYAYTAYPFLTPPEKGFSEMLFSFWKMGYKKFYAYSDHPHIRRTEFLEKFGRYAEGKKVEKTEYLMMMRFLRKKGKAVIYEDVHALFEQMNTSGEPSTVTRNSWRRSEGFVFTNLRHLYRHIKFNLDYLFG